MHVIFVSGLFLIDIPAPMYFKVSFQFHFTFKYLLHCLYIFWSFWLIFLVNFEPVAHLLSSFWQFWAYSEKPFSQFWRSGFSQNLSKAIWDNLRAATGPILNPQMHLKLTKSDEEMSQEKHKKTYTNNKQKWWLQTLLAEVLAAARAQIAKFQLGPRKCQKRLPKWCFRASILQPSAINLPSIFEANFRACKLSIYTRGGGTPPSF